MLELISGRLREVTVRPTVGAGERCRWDALMGAHHYLPFRGLVGRSVRTSQCSASSGSRSSAGTPARSSSRPATAGSGGCRVLENRAFDAPPGEDVWLRTLEVRAEQAGKVERILSIWRKCDDDPDRFCMVEERAREDLSPPVRRWVELAQRVAEMRGG